MSVANCFISRNCMCDSSLQGYSLLLFELVQFIENEGSKIEAIVLLAVQTQKIFKLEIEKQYFFLFIIQIFTQYLQWNFSLKLVFLNLCELLFNRLKWLEKINSNQLANLMLKIEQLGKSLLELIIQCKKCYF